MLKMKRVQRALRCLFLVGLFAAVFSGVGKADLVSVTITDTLTTGAKYTLWFDTNPIATSGSINTYDVFLQVDTSPLTLSNANTYWLADVAIKLTNSVEGVGATAGKSSLAKVTNDTTNTLLTASWGLKQAGLGAKGCVGKDSGSLCAYDKTTLLYPNVGTAYPAPPDVFTWEFYYATDNTLAAGDTVGIKAGYNYWSTTGSATKQKHTITNKGITSLETTVTSVNVPDGGLTVVLLGGALIGLETIRRRFRA